MKSKLVKGYEWGVQFAKKRYKRGRAMEGMLIGIKRELIEKETKIESDGEGIMVGRVRQRKESWRIVGVYVGESIERILERLRRWGEEREERVTMIIGGDFNARTGEEGGGPGEEEEEGEGDEESGKRQSKDGKVNDEKIGRVY